MGLTFALSLGSWVVSQVFARVDVSLMYVKLIAKHTSFEFS